MSSAVKQLASQATRELLKQIPLFNKTEFDVRTKLSLFVNTVLWIRSLGN